MFVLQIHDLAPPVSVKLTVHIRVSSIQMSSPLLSEKKPQPLEPKKDSLARGQALSTALGGGDSVVAAVIEKFQQRSDLGIKKYGTTLDREDLGLQDWIQHVQEELMDAILYLEKLKKITADKVLSNNTE